MCFIFASWCSILLQFSFSYEHLLKLSCLAQRHKRKRLLGGNPRCFTLQVCSSFCWVLEFVNSVATPLYLYFQVLCQVFASIERKFKSLDVLSRNRLCTLHWKIIKKSPDHLYDPNLLHNMIQVIGFVSLVLSFLIWATQVPL